MSHYVVVAARIEEELADLERVVTRAESLWAKYEQSGDDGFLDGVALNLHGFYAGIERIFEEIARTIDTSAPSGSDWHRSLILQMSAPVVGLRPAAISRTSRFCLDEYRGFRHVVRNIYTFNLRPTRLQELTVGLRGCYTALQHDLSEFRAFLQQVDRGTE
ncbi:hypothetical protein [Candidatus Viridilinea mediisalina]|uniref:HepT-like domain-containing protein n=1 Tax=Candidatus Viridilinea mediisalina TaxID=2024553 RepID=A0A2A6RHP1_9CHLR|nr:hypothetical protein [Candidatus Viridilinea mediisalina]PDW02453.1 hypothetical protein CJ255_13885 [Candidatus Viridilinea mediisalina]